MVVLFSATIISCQQVIDVVNNLRQVVGLSYNQKIEIVREITKVVPNCPIIVKSKTK